jgi:hypothetical protein
MTADYKTRHKFLGVTFAKTVKEGFTTRKYALGIPYTRQVDPDALNHRLSEIERLLQKIAVREASQPGGMTLQDVYNTLSVCDAHQRIFPKYKNIHQDKEIVLVATGPSLNKYQQPIPNAIHIGVNKAFKYDKTKFEYLFLQDYAVSKSYIEEFCAYDAKKFFGIISDIWPQSIVPESIAARHGVARYHVAHPDELSKPTYNIAASIFWDAYSVVFPVMQFIFWTNPKKIYLVGCDCSGGYFDGKGVPHAVENLVHGWKEIKEFAAIHYPETEIVSINPVGLRGLFKDFDTE